MWSTRRRLFCKNSKQLYCSIIDHTLRTVMLLYSCHKPLLSFAKGHSPLVADWVNIKAQYLGDALITQRSSTNPILFIVDFIASPHLHLLSVIPCLPCSLFPVRSYSVRLSCSALLIRDIGSSVFVSSRYLYQQHRIDRDSMDGIYGLHNRT
jgi:hypothetical protein